MLVIRLGLGLVELGSGLELVLGLAAPFGMAAWNHNYHALTTQLI